MRRIQPPRPPSILWALCVVVILCPVGALADTIVSIQPSGSTVAPGQNFSLDVSVSGVNDLFAFQFDLGFDPTVLSAASISEGPFLPSGGATSFIPGTIDNSAGTISFTADTLVGSIPGVNGSGVLAVGDFKALTGGASPITLSGVTLLDSSLSPITSTVQNGSVNLAAVPEPTTVILLGSGLAGLMMARRRKKVPKTESSNRDKRYHAV